MTNTGNKIQAKILTLAERKIFGRLGPVASALANGILEVFSN